MYLPLNCIKLSVSVNQSNIRLLTRRITRLAQAQASFTEELGVGKIRITNEKYELALRKIRFDCIQLMKVEIQLRHLYSRAIIRLLLVVSLLACLFILLLLCLVVFLSSYLSPGLSPLSPLSSSLSPSLFLLCFFSVTVSLLACLFILLLLCLVVFLLICIWLPLCLLLCFLLCYFLYMSPSLPIFLSSSFSASLSFSEYICLFICLLLCPCLSIWDLCIGRFDPLWISSNLR